jgi:uncharacterized membrane protein (UPF0182 family)
MMERPLSSRLVPTVLVILVASLVIGSSTLIHLLTESWWFEAVGFKAVFQTQLMWPIALGGASLAVHLGVLGVNYKIAAHFTDDLGVKPLYRSGRSLPLSSSRLPPWVGIALVLLLSITAAMHFAGQWQQVLQYVYRTPFGETDPIFDLDIGFYIFQLPFYAMLQRAAISLLGGSLFVAVLLYAIKGAIDFNRGWRQFLDRPAKIHLGILLAVLTLLIATGLVLERYDILYSTKGVAFGAGYTDVHARLQAYSIMTVLTLGLGLVFVLSLWRKDLILPVSGVVGYGAALILVMGVYPQLQQRLQVEPNELTKETPYITYNLDFTRKAYGLNQVQQQTYEVQRDLTAANLQNHQATLHNIRLWNDDPILSTYRQLQELRPYYRFQGVDIDRYPLNGDYQQVMLSAREMEVERLPSQTWVNQRLKYTHGYGLVMSPVDRVNPDGLPELLIKDLPPVAPPDLSIQQPAIYYGESTRNYIFTGTSTDEFDYPLGNDNASVRYSGVGGVPLPSLWHRLMYAMDMGNLKVLISQYFTPQSRIHYYRQIQERVSHIAPFLYLDHDPYLVLAQGRLQWILDAYTFSDRYPYSQPLMTLPGAEQLLNFQGKNFQQYHLNYLRNSVKIVVDAYEGTVTFYALDEAPYGELDPLLETYRKAFPTLFTSGTKLPPALRQHLRYPQDLFTIQSLAYLSYHMENPEVFYNKEDLWSFPSEISENNKTILSQPYYVVMQLLGETNPEMVLILPFTPVNKDNMIAWLAARSDGDRYGHLLLYKFPKQALVYGPNQIEARIDQTPEISQQLTLWSQQGSRVIRGNLVVIPIRQSLLYVEPIYLRAEQGELPELRRVIVVYGDQVVMEPTLAQGLTAVFGQLSPSPFPQNASSQSPSSQSPFSQSSSSQTVPPPLSPRGTSPQKIRNLILQAQKVYDQGQNALLQGDWQTYGQSQQALKKILQELDQQTR